MLIKKSCIPNSFANAKNTQCINWYPGGKFLLIPDDSINRKKVYLKIEGLVILLRLSDWFSKFCFFLRKPLFCNMRKHCSVQRLIERWYMQDTLLFNQLFVINTTGRYRIEVGWVIHILTSQKVRLIKWNILNVKGNILKGLVAKMSTFKYQIEVYWSMSKNY